MKSLELRDLRRRDELVLLAVEVDRSLVPPRRRLAAAEQGAGDADDLAGRRRQVDQPAVAQGQAVGGDEAQAAGVDVAGVDDAAGLAGVVAVEAELGPDAEADALAGATVGAGL